MNGVSYDPLDTVQWMLDGVRGAVIDETKVTPDGKTKRKTKSEREADRLRFETLVEVVWNVQGRPEPLEALAARYLSTV